jgi:hypothetical protein
VLHAGAVSVRGGERVLHLGAASERNGGKRVQRHSGAVSECYELLRRRASAASAFLGLHEPGTWEKGWVLTIGKGSREIHHFLDECMIGRSNTS